jgi:hypothetical protein
VILPPHRGLDHQARSTRQPLSSRLPENQSNLTPQLIVSKMSAWMSASYPVSFQVPKISEEIEKSPGLAVDVGRKPSYGLVVVSPFTIICQ